MRIIIDKSKLSAIIKEIKTEEVGKMFSSFGKRSMEKLEDSTVLTKK